MFVFFFFFLNNRPVTVKANKSSTEKGQKSQKKTMANEAVTTIETLEEDDEFEEFENEGIVTYMKERVEERRRLNILFLCFVIKRVLVYKHTS